MYSPGYSGRLRKRRRTARFCTMAEISQYHQKGKRYIGAKNSGIRLDTANNCFYFFFRFFQISLGFE